MFVKETKVKRSGREYSYLQLVEGYRDENGKVRHRVVANLGRKDALKDSGQLEALAGSFARLDPPMAGTRRSVGPLLLVEHFLRELAVQGHRRCGRCRAAPGRSCRSVRSCARWSRAGCARPRRCMTSPGGRRVRRCTSCSGSRRRCSTMTGSVGRWRRSRSTAEHLRSQVAARAIERFGVGAGRLHVDLTTVGVTGAYEDSALVAKGWASDRRVARQVRTLQAVNAGRDGALQPPGSRQRGGVDAGRRVAGAAA